MCCGERCRDDLWHLWRTARHGLSCLGLCFRKQNCIWNGKFHMFDALKQLLSTITVFVKHADKRWVEIAVLRCWSLAVVFVTLSKPEVCESVPWYFMCHACAEILSHWSWILNISLKTAGQNTVQGKPRFIFFHKKDSLFSSLDLSLVLSRGGV